MAKVAIGLVVFIPTLPLVVTAKKEAPEVEAMAKIGIVWVEVEATRNKVPPLGVEELIIKDLTVLSQRKLEEPEVEEAVAPPKTIWLTDKLPESLLLNVAQSVLES